MFSCLTCASSLILRISSCISRTWSWNWFYFYLRFISEIFFHSNSFYYNVEFLRILYWTLPSFLSLELILFCLKFVFNFNSYNIFLNLKFFWLLSKIKDNLQVSTVMLVWHSVPMYELSFFWLSVSMKGLHDSREWDFKSINVYRKTAKVLQLQKEKWPLKKTFKPVDLKFLYCALSILPVYF